MGCDVRIVCVIFMLVLAGCQNGQNEVSRNMENLVPGSNLAQQDKSALLQLVIERIRPVSEAMCKENNPTKPDAFCKLNVTLDKNFGNSPRASFSFQRDGSPIITISRSMLDGVANADELGFVIAHEAGHQISDHIHAARGEKSFGLTRSTEPSSFVMQRVNLKRLELEADAIGTIIAFKAGFDPITGSKALERFTPKRSAAAYTHPDLERRSKIVRATVERLEAGDEFTF